MALSPSPIPNQIRYKQKLEKERKDGKSSNGNGTSGPQSPESVYESAEHLAGSLPGFGMRVSVSRQDLATLEKEQLDKWE